MRHTIRIKQQRGATLVIGLVMLFLLTILGLSAMRTSTYQEMMSGNIQNKQMAFQAAESALVAAETWMASQTMKPDESTTCSSTPCVLTYDATRYVEDQTDTWWQSNAAQYSGSLNNIATAPYYTFEYKKFISDDLTLGAGIPTGKHYYAISSKATGGNSTAQSLLQTTYARRF